MWPSKKSLVVGLALVTATAQADASLRQLRSEVSNSTSHPTTITDDDGEWQLAHNVTVQPPGTVGPSNDTKHFQEFAATPTPTATTHTQSSQSTPMGGLVAIGAIGIVAVGVAAAVAHKKKQQH